MRRLYLLLRLKSVSLLIPQSEVLIMIIHVYTLHYTVQISLHYCKSKYTNGMIIAISLYVTFISLDGARHFIYSHKYYTNSAEDSFDMS